MMLYISFCAERELPKSRVFGLGVEENTIKHLAELFNFNLVCYHSNTLPFYSVLT